MSYFLSPLIRQRFFDDVTGAPLAGGQLYTYAAGTTTPQDTYSNSTGTANTNPVVLDSNGYADVWIDPTLSYKFVLEDANSNVLWTVDNISSPFEITAWSSTISYSMGEIVQDSSGYGLFYVSLTNNNVNNALTSVSNWRRLGGNIRTVSTNTTLLATDELVRSNSTSGNLTHTLPPCSTTSIGTKITIKDVGTGGNYTQVKGNGSDNIDGANTWSIKISQYIQATFENNGTSWDAVAGISGPVTAAQIANNTITATQIANATITATQIASATITSTQIAASNYQISSSSGGFSTTSASFVQPTDLSVTITTVGSRPVFISLIPDGNTSNISNVGIDSGTNLFWQITRDGSAINYGFVSVGGSINANFPPGAFSFIDTGASAGSHTYAFLVHVQTSGTVSVAYCSLAVWQPGA